MKYTTDHTVYYNDNNEEVPSATTVLKILNKPSLVSWANFLGFKRIKTEDVLKDTSAIGTVVHEAIRAIIRKSEYVYIKMDDIPPLSYIAGHLRAFLRWYNSNTIEAIFLEKPFHTDTFGGTVDFYGKVNGKLSIIDFKTSKKIRLSMFLQLALYTIMLEKNGYEVEQVGIVLCNPDHHNVKYVSREDLEEYIGIAELLVELFHKYYNIDKKDKWGESLI